MNEKNVFDILNHRIQLQARGIIVPPGKGETPVYHKQSTRGGAGPQGFKYYICSAEDETPSKMISLPIYPEDHYLAKYAIITRRSADNPDYLLTEDGVVMKPVPPPNTRNMILSDGTPVANIIFNIHCYGTAISNMSIACTHFETNGQCKYCTADILQKKMDPSWSKEEYLVETLEMAVKHDNIHSITTTSGTVDNPDETAKRFIQLAQKIKKTTNRSLHIQLEPTSDPSLLHELSKYVDSVGIFLEIFDEKIRNQICPGKSRVPKARYFESWRAAVEYFGAGNVMTTCILGFGEDFDGILGDIEECIKLGVRVSVALLRPGSESLGKNYIPSYLDKEKELLDFHIKVAQLHVKYGVDFKLMNGAGCIGCQGCTAMMEACHYARLLNKKISRITH